LRAHDLSWVTNWVTTGRHTLRSHGSRSLRCTATEYSNLTGLSDTQQDTVRSDSHSRLGECLILGNVPIIHTEEVTG
jgi:hypothetical protein